MTLRVTSSDRSIGTISGMIRRYRQTTFSSLMIRNYRLYFIGQGISLCGTWMQGIAQSWLVVELARTHAGTWLGIVTAMQFAPVLLLAPYGGLLADRFPKRRILFATQSAAAVLALGLGTLVATGVIRIWMVACFALALGVINAIDNPTRQSFVRELVDRSQVKNAITLNSLEVNLCRIVGPSMAALVILRFGVAPCFLFNGVSFIAVLVCLFLMRDSELHRGPLVAAAKGQLVEGFRYVRNSPVIRTVLIMMTIVGTLTYEFQVTLTLLSKYRFHAGASGLAWLTCFMGVGAVLGGLVIAGRKRADVTGLTITCFAFGVTTLLVALAPSLPWAVAGMVLVGIASLAFTSLTNTILQLEAEPKMRGRVMSLWTMAFLGSTVVGAPIIGWAGENDPRWSLVVGGVAALFAGAIGALALRRKAQREADDSIESPAIGEKEDYV